MRIFFLILFLVFGIRGFSQDSLSANIPVKMFLISTQASWNGDSSAAVSQDTTAGILTAFETMDLKTDPSMLTVLSIVDIDGSISKNWNKFIEQYKNGNYLIVVDRGDGTDKFNFVKYFYQQRLNGIDVEEAYTLASEQSRNLSPSLLHFLSIKK